MQATPLDEKRLAIVKDYFHKADHGDPSIFDLLKDDVSLYFPKFGTRVGKAEVGNFVQGLFSRIETLRHDPDNYVYMVAGDRIVVEGTEYGVLRNGDTWPIAGKSDGRFCNVFSFDGELISSVSIYTDPDFTGEDTARFFWGQP